MAALLAPAAAYAEEEGGTPTPTTTTTTKTAAAAEGEDEPKSETDDTWIAVAFIVFSGFSILVLFVYLGRSQSQFFISAREVFGQTGVVPEPVSIPLVPALSVRGLAAEEKTLVDIKGSPTFTVGQEVTFSALLEGKDVSVTWDVSPAECASPSSGVGTSITFKASKPAALTLTAKTEDGKGEGIVQVSATAAETNRPTLPFVGENYGAALIAIVAVAGVVVLGLTDAIKGEAIATFFGALLGYAFGKGVQSSQSGTTTSPNSGSDAQE